MISYSSGIKMCIYMDTKKVYRVTVMIWGGKNVIMLFLLVIFFLTSYNVHVLIL